MVRARKERQSSLFDIMVGITIRCAAKNLILKSEEMASRISIRVDFAPYQGDVFQRPCFAETPDARGRAAEIVSCCKK